VSALGDVPSIEEPDFAAVISRPQVGPVELRLAGIADSRAAAALEELVARLHGVMVAEGERAVVVDLRALEFMSALAFNALVGWLGKVNELAAEQRYQIRFRSHPELPWQRRSLKTLACFATDLVTIERERGPA
jgi:hypothetical protein